jgi:hypothetical protein
LRCNNSKSLRTELLRRDNTIRMVPANQTTILASVEEAVVAAEVVAWVEVVLVEDVVATIATHSNPTMTTAEAMVVAGWVVIVVVAMAENREVTLLSRDLSLTLEDMHPMTSRIQVAMANNNNLSSRE